MQSATCLTSVILWETENIIIIDFQLSTVQWRSTTGICYSDYGRLLRKMVYLHHFQDSVSRIHRKLSLHKIIHTGLVGFSSSNYPLEIFIEVQNENICIKDLLGKIKKILRRNRMENVTLVILDIALMIMCS